MVWPELRKAKDNVDNIYMEINRLIKNSNALTRKELANNADTIISQLDQTIEAVENESTELLHNLNNHRKYLAAKRRFVRRHYKRV